MKIITHHAHDRIEERFSVYWIWVDDVMKDIQSCRRVICSKKWWFKLIGKFGIYVIDHNKHLITAYPKDTVKHNVKLYKETWDDFFIHKHPYIWRERSIKPIFA